ncbi:MAG: hypothetical protein KDI79_05575 [Anaerolineae bacterium]|nr:hypothetical protein [Anaerolineae bacterium]
MLKKIFVIVMVIFALAACGGQSAAPTATLTVISDPTATPVPSEVVETEEAAVEAPAPTQEVAEQPAATEEVVIEDPTSEPVPTEEVMAAEPTAEVVAEVMVNTKLNLNQATGDDYLAAIPNFSNRMVREFLEYRPYISIQQFRREIGKYVDEAQVAEYEQYVYVPVDVDESDAATLQQIPGVDETIANELMAARPYGSNEAFLTKLAEYLPAPEVAAAGGYLVSQ